MEEDNDHYSTILWNNFQNTLSSGFNSLLKDEDLVDVTLATDGKYIKAHKTVLSVCSSYFRELFKMNPCKHPIVIFPNVNYNILCNLLTFMYQGEVSVSQDEIASFLKVAESLKIKGLTDNAKKFISTENNQLIQKSNVNEGIEMLNNPKEEPLDNSENNTTFEKFEENSMDYEDELRATSPNFVDILSLKTEGNIENMISDEDLGEPSCQNAETELQSNQTQINRLANKSKEVYLHEYSVYKKWCEKKNLEISIEQAMLEYLDEKSKVLKPSSLWVKYSMLKATLAAQDSIHIKFPKVINFLKSKGNYSHTQPTRTFTIDDINKFLLEAPDEKYLMMKLVLILGISGACRICELTMMKTTDIEDKESVLIVRIPGDGNKARRTFVVNNKSNFGINLIDIYRRYIALRKPKTEHKRLFVNYKEGQCTVQVVGIHTIGAIPRVIAKFLQKPNFNEYTGYCFRRTSEMLKKNTRMML